MKILLLDDEPFELRLMELLLRKLGFEHTLSHTSAQDALVQLQAESTDIDLILCDLQMPDMDGVELIRHLQQRAYPGALILVSGEDERILSSVERLARAHRLNVLGAFHKPVDWDFLFSAGCDLAQGYFIAHPMPASDLASWQTEWSARQRELIPSSG